MISLPFISRLEQSGRSLLTPLCQGQPYMADLRSAIVKPTRESAGTSRVGKLKWRAFISFAAFLAFVHAPCRADVAAPPPPPPPPAGYCTQIYNELYGDLQAFNTTLATPPAWTPLPGGATLYAGNLEWANGNTGPAISSPNYFQDNLQPPWDNFRMGEVCGAGIAISRPKAAFLLLTSCMQEEEVGSSPPELFTRHRSRGEQRRLFDVPSMMLQIIS